MSLNRAILSLHFEEALEELERIVATLKEDAVLNEDDMRSYVEHLYHHINSGWNAKSKSDDYFESEGTEEFYVDRRMPEDISSSFANQEKVNCT